MNDADRKLLPLLSGWLDGELTADDAQRVEEALRHSPELRAVLEEWRGLDETIPGTIPSRPEADWEALAMRVENAVQAEATADAQTQRPTLRKAGTEPRSDAAGWFDRLRLLWGSHRWALGGGGSIVAAALLVLLLWPDPQGRLRDAGVTPESITPPAESSPVGLPPAPPPPEAQPPVAPPPTAPSTATTTPPSVGKAEESRDASDAREGAGMPTPARSTTASRPQPQPPTAEPEPVPARHQAAPRADQPKQASPPPEVTPRPREAQQKTDQQATDDLLETPVKSFQLQSMSRAQQDRMTIRESVPQMLTEEEWRYDTETDLQKAVADQDREALENLVGDIDRHRTERTTSSDDVATLGLSLRARGQLLRLFPDALEQPDACARLRQDYDLWRQRADGDRASSWEGVQIRDLVRDACPQ
jgi:hypothetical protein